eukprot:IDg8272t1
MAARFLLVNCVQSGWVCYVVRRFALLAKGRTVIPVGHGQLMGVVSAELHCCITLVGRLVVGSFPLPLVVSGRSLGRYMSNRVGRSSELIARRLGVSSCESLATKVSPKVGIEMQ